MFLAELVDLHDVDQAGVEIGFEQSQRAQLGSSSWTRRCGPAATAATGRRIRRAAGTTGDEAGTGAARAAAANAGVDAELSGGHATDTAGALAGEAGQAGAAEETTAACDGSHRTGRAVADRDRGVKALPIALERRKLASKFRSTIVNCSRATTRPPRRSSG